MRSAFALLFGVCFQAEGAALRATTAGPSKANNSSDANEALDAAMSMVGAMQSQLKPKPASTHHSNVSVSDGHRAKLDVGFSGFETNLTQAMNATMLKSTASPQWTQPLRQELITNVTANVSASLKDSLKAVKQSIGKTWMALPEDDQKDLYIVQLKAQFEPVLEEYLGSIMKRFDIGAHRVEAYSNQRKALASADLLARSEQAFSDIIVSQRCYKGDSLLQLGSFDQELMQLDSMEMRLDAPQNASNTTRRHKLGNFCMPSVVSKLAGRLNDQQGLLSMTMRFEARALDLAQTTAKAKAPQQHRKMVLR